MWAWEFRDNQKCRKLFPEKRIRPFLHEALISNKFIKYFKPATIEEMKDLTYMREYSAGATILAEDEAVDFFFIVEEGEFEIVEFNNKETVKGVIGQVYGEDELLVHKLKLLTIQAITNCKIWRLDLEDFEHIIRWQGGNAKNSEVLRNYPLFARKSEDALLELADILEIETYTEEEVVFLRRSTLYIISNGALKLQGPNGSIVKVLSWGEYFDDNIPPNHDFVPFHPGVELLVIEKKDVDKLIRKRDDFYLHPSNFSEKIIRDPWANIKFNDLKLIDTIGEGSFGRVELVAYSRKWKTDYFALKKINKRRTVKGNCQHFVISERRILLRCDNPFIVKLHKTFRDDEFVYLLLEACLGGDVATFCRRIKVLDKETARYITASAVEALEYLHNKNIIYRDLKASNLVIDQYGNVKASDFGLSKHLGHTGKTWTYCGSKCNMAPEIILNEGQDRAVDLWALGTMIYRLLSGCNAFYHRNPLVLFERILEGIELNGFSSKVSDRQAEYLIMELCKREPSERLGYNNIIDLKKHKWFSGFNWDALKARTLLPPRCLIPKLHYAGDTSNFEKVMDCEGKLVKEMSNWDQEFE